MSKHIQVCSKCKIYTLQANCSHCQNLTLLARPPKFSLDNKYAAYRREIKLPELKRLGLH